MKYLLLALGGYVLYEWWQSSQANATQAMPGTGVPTTLAPDLGQGSTGATYGQGGTVMPTLPPVISAPMPNMGLPPMMQTPASQPPVMTTQATVLIPHITMRKVAALAHLFHD